MLIKVGNACISREKPDGRVDPAWMTQTYKDEPPVPGRAPNPGDRPERISSESKRHRQLNEARIL